MALFSRKSDRVALRSSKRARRPALEGLEDRALLNGAVQANLDTVHGTLSITGDQFNNSIAIVENANGTVTVQGQTLTSVNTNSSYTTPLGSPVTAIKVSWGAGQNGNETVNLSGYNGKVQTVSIIAGSGTDHFTLANTKGNSLTVSATGKDTLSVDTSTFNSAAITAGSGTSSVSLTNDTLGFTTVIEGNGLGDRITAANDTFGPTTLTQGNGLGDSVSLTNISSFSLGISQGGGDFDFVSANGLALNPLGTGVTVAQGGGFGDSATVSAITAPSVSVSQGGGSLDEATVTGFTVSGPVSITQGNGSGDGAAITNGTAGGAASIAQGNGSGDIATVDTVGASNVIIAQGNGDTDVVYVDDTAVAGAVNISNSGGDATINLGTYSLGLPAVSATSVSITTGGSSNAIDLQNLLTTFLTVSVGTGGGNTVEAGNVGVLSYSGTIVGGGAFDSSNNFIDDTGKFGFTWPTTWNVIS
jgi:hypothetical protein